MYMYIYIYRRDSDSFTMQAKHYGRQKNNEVKLIAFDQKVFGSIYESRFCRETV